MTNRPLRIPDADRSWADAFLEAHPEQRERMRELFDRDREMRDLAEALVADLHGYHTTGVPSRWGLLVSLRAYAALLDEDDARMRRAEEADHLELGLVHLEAGLETQARGGEPSEHARFLTAFVEELRGQLSETRVARMAEARLMYKDINHAEVEALRATADAVRNGATAADIDRHADEVEHRWRTLDEIVTGIEPGVGGEDDEGQA